MHLLAKEEITMAMVVKNNMAAVNTLNTLNKNQGALAKSLAKVSSGQKINSAQDDASGYAISERMRVMVRALDQATQNTQNGSAMMKVAEGAVANTVEILKTLKEKAINSATDTNQDEDRATIQKEIDQFIDQIDDNALVTFNGKYLVDGSKASAAKATQTVLLNQSLMKGATSVAFTDLADRAGNSLNIVEGDTIKLSWISQGVYGSYETTIGTDTSKGDVAPVTLKDLFENALTPDNAKTNGVFSGSWISDTKGETTFTFAVEDVGGKTGKAIGSDTSGNAVYTPDGGDGITLKLMTGATGYDVNADANSNAIKQQISGFTITITDKYGNSKKSANEHLEFSTAIFAANRQDEDQALKIHVGATAGQTISIGMKDMRAEALGLKNAAGETIKISTADQANAAIAALDAALKKALDQATTIGAIEARLEYTASNLTTSSENVQAAESTIRDADMAKEMTNYTKNNVLLQAAQSMLAQANQNSSAVLSLLQ
jgi:flagellin